MDRGRGGNRWIDRCVDERWVEMVHVCAACSSWHTWGWPGINRTREQGSWAGDGLSHVRQRRFRQRVARGVCNEARKVGEGYML